MEALAASSPEKRKATIRESDWYPMLMTRAWPFRDLVAEFDTYQSERHLPDLVAAPGAAMVGYYENVVAGLPQAYKGSGNRLANYIARNIDDLFCWLRSSEFADAVEDGGRTWFGRMNELDYDLYTGNVYSVGDVAKVDDGKTRIDLPLLVERFEVTYEEEEDFDLWMSKIHLPSLANEPGVLRVRSCTALREDLPLPYYVSPGNRMLIADLDDANPLSDTLLSPGLRAAVGDSLQWDLRLSYVRRDVYRFLLSRGSA